MEMKSLQYILHPPFNVGLVDSCKDFYTGCIVFSVTFPKTSYVEIEEIHFKNYYTASLSILARKRGAEKTDNEDNRDWKLFLKAKQLMPHPHCEQSSEDYFVLKSSDFLFSQQNIIELQFVLFQPSPVWKEFKIEELQLFKAGSNSSKEATSLPAWISELGSSKDEACDRQLKGVTSVVELSKQMHQLWALTEQARASQTKTSLGRYDVDGCYDINLLSYN